MPSNKVSIITTDQVTIIGEYNKPEAAKQVVLLLHMMPVTKENWQPLVELLNKKGLATLAIDLRGHGESVAGSGGRVLNYKNFSNAEHQASGLDVAASLEFLKRDGFSLSDVAVVGASIGGNLALQSLEKYPEIKKAAALSPGLDFRGVMTLPVVQKLSEAQKIFLVAAEDDSYSADTVKALAKESKAPTTLKIYTRGGHGTNIWDNEPTLLVSLVEWLSN